jgi:hypothetical protein
MVSKSKSPVRGRYIFVDHSNLWGGARWASKCIDPAKNDHDARVSIKAFNKLIGGRRDGVISKIVSGGIPPGMEGLWEEYQRNGFDTQRLIRDIHWKERGVDHSLIGHMWRLLAKHRESDTDMVLVSGDGKHNEFNTSFREIVEEVLLHSRYQSWNVILYSFDINDRIPEGSPNSPTHKKMRTITEESERGTFVNLTYSYDELVYHE